MYVAYITRPIDKCQYYWVLPPRLYVKEHFYFSCFVLIYNLTERSADDFHILKKSHQLLTFDLWHSFNTSAGIIGHKCSV